ncbi:peroxisome membrane protein, partial [Jimgerdemannia flammicorona]
MNLLKKYEDFLIKNASQITAIESSLRSLTYILPVFAALNLLGLYHDSILTRAAAALVTSSPAAAAQLPPPSTFNRYTRFWYSSSNAYKRIAMLLTFVSYTEVLIEMGVQKKWGTKAKWRLVTAIERGGSSLVQMYETKTSLKPHSIFLVICRLSLLHLTNKRTLLHPSHPERDIDPSALHSQSLQSDTPDSDTWTGARTGAVRPHLTATIMINNKNGSANGHAGGEHNGDANMNGKPKHADVTEFLLSKVITPDHLKKPADLVRVLKGLGRVGEYLFIIRPLIYGLSLFSLSPSHSASLDHLSSHPPVAHTVLAIARYGRRSWYPWLLSLSMELASRGATRHHFSSPYDSFRTTMSQLEKEEASRRVWLLLFYILREPFYERFT